MIEEKNLRAHIEHLTKKPRVPHSEGYFAAQKYIIETLQAQNWEVKIHSFKDLRMGVCKNIYVESGDSSAPARLVGGHYESCKQSGVAADDNASAVAVLLELARELKNSNQAFTLVFFDIEENFGIGPLRGSKAFAPYYKRPIDYAVIMDLVGGSLTPTLENAYFQFGEALPTLTGEDLEFFHLPIKFVEPLGRLGARSDYDAFRVQGIPFTFLSSGTPWYYHTPYDTPEILRFEKMTKFTKALHRHLLENSSSSKNPAPWNRFRSFMSKLAECPELKTPHLEKMKTIEGEPSRWQLLRLHWDVLTRIKKQGPALWKNN
ncbi:MAG: M28 family peptidase [Deltaproteobacteria bacterium]|nr:M28 family peptidase [Deltaproteobacteria bacterium]